MQRKGFAPLIAIGIIAVVIVVGVAGYFIWKNSTDSNSSVSPTPPCCKTTSVATSTEVQLQGGVAEGQQFEEGIGNGLVFKLTPDNGGWDIDIFPENAAVNDYGLASVATPPYHGFTALNIVPSEFENADDITLETRNFQFVTNEADAKTIADAYEQFSEGKTNDFSPNVPFGQGTLTIQNLKLNNSATGSQPSIASMNFSVNLQFPTSTPISSSGSGQAQGCTLLPYTGTVPLSQVPYTSPGDPDFRNGMVCKFIINPSLPIFTFHFAGQADNSFGNIEITEGSSTNIIQTIDEHDGIYPDALAPSTYQSVLVPVDANFDGYEDLPIQTQCGATGNCSYDFYLYNPATNQFVYNSFLSSIGTFQINSSAKQITAISNGSFDEGESDTYQYENGQYVLIEKRISTPDNATSYTVQIYQLENGQMELTSSTTSNAY